MDYEVSHKIINAWTDFIDLISTMEIQNENVEFATKFMRTFHIQNMNHELSLLKLDEPNHIQLSGFIARNQEFKPIVQSFLDKAYQSDPQKFSESCSACGDRCVPGPIQCKSCVYRVNIMSSNLNK